MSVFQPWCITVNNRRTVTFRLSFYLSVYLFCLSRWRWWTSPTSCVWPKASPLSQSTYRKPLDARLPNRYKLINLNLPIQWTKLSGLERIWCCGHGGGHTRHLPVVLSLSCFFGWTGGISYLRCHCCPVEGCGEDWRVQTVCWGGRPSRKFPGDCASPPRDWWDSPRNSFPAFFGTACRDCILLLHIKYFCCRFIWPSLNYTNAIQCSYNYSGHATSSSLSNSILHT